MAHESNNSAVYVESFIVRQRRGFHTASILLVSLVFGGFALLIDHFDIGPNPVEIDSHIYGWAIGLAIGMLANGLWDIMSYRREQPGSYRVVIDTENVNISYNGPKRGFATIAKNIRGTERLEDVDFTIPVTSIRGVTRVRRSWTCEHVQSATRCWKSACRDHSNQEPQRAYEGSRKTAQQPDSGSLTSTGLRVTKAAPGLATDGCAVLLLRVELPAQFGFDEHPEYLRFAEMQREGADIA